MIAGRWEPFPDVLISAFEPDVVLPAQFVAGSRRMMPERLLLVAVLQDAVDCLQKYRHVSGRRHRLFREAEAWFASNRSDWVFAFEYICDVLGLDAKGLRRTLLNSEASAMGDAGGVNHSRRAAQRVRGRVVAVRRLRQRSVRGGDSDSAPGEEKAGGARCSEARVGGR